MGLVLAELVACLRGGGLTCRVDAERSLGEPDFRLQVRRPSGEVIAQLLGPAARDGGWQAVRVTGEDREVWELVVGEGAAAVSSFLCDLVALPAAVLLGRYDRLG